MIIAILKQYDRNDIIPDAGPLAGFAVDGDTIGKKTGANITIERFSKI